MSKTRIFRLELELENAAFFDDDGDHAPEYEISRILELASKRIHPSCGYKGTTVLTDCNGNQIGCYEFLEEDDD
jgi:hypothetical protein